jgi:hypothetical protein
MATNAMVVMMGLAAATLFGAVAASAEEKAAGKERFFEMRTYTAAEGKIGALHARFRDHTNALFAKHGIEMIGYWTPVNEKDGSKNKLVYILAYPSQEAREAAWKAFAADPEWVKAKAASEASGKLVDKVESVYMKPTDYSPMK